MTTRRDFIKKGVMGATVLSVGGVLPGFSAKSYRSIVGANEKIRVGAIGVNARGNALAAGFAVEKGCEIAYVCDVDRRAMEKCIGNVNNIAGNNPIGIKDIRKLLELKDLDAVFIATPEHWHAPAALMAMKAGKHVYLEKPTAHNPAENEILIEAAKRYKTVVATGMQRRSWPNVIQAINEIKEGVIGRVYHGKAWYTANRASIGVGKITAVPDWLDWELWQGPAPAVPHFKDNVVHYNWHWFNHWGTGESGNNAVHFLDLLRWGMDVSYPTEVNSMGGRYRFDDDWEFPDTQVVNLGYGKDKMITWEGRSCNGRGFDSSSVGCTFYGEEGSLAIKSGNAYNIFDLKGELIKSVQSEIQYSQGDTVNPSRRLDSYHFENFLDSIRKGTALYADIETGAISTTLALLGNIAQRTGVVLKTDPANGQILNSAKAKKLWSRKYAKGWEMKL